MSDSIQVAIKVRPLIKREKDENLQIQWSVVDNILVPTDPEKKRGESGFQFDHIFDPEKTNNDVFETVVKPIVDAAVKGFNGTVFAYGQTSSGKTHTMLGTEIEPGIIPMAIERMFDSIAETCGREFLLRVSYLEIYNEKVNDLLDTSSIDLKLREDSNGLVQVLKCKEEIASSPDTIMAIMKKGDKNRRIGETDMNDRSSRSHTIFRITIESRDQSSDSDGAIQVSQLNLVDLAGSERARQTNATGERFKEGTHINMSLSTLGLVIKQLSESSDSTKYINFRDSKLTRLLQASLGGNAMTTIICAVTPAAFEETQCTLWFASRAKSVKNKPQLNEVMSDAALLKRYKKQLAKLNEELERLKNENRIAEVQEMESKLQEKEHKLQETDRINQILEERIQLLKNGIISADSAKDESNTKIPRSKRRRTWAGDRALSARFSLCAKNLPTIKEICTSPESKSNHTEKNNIRSRKSIIQTVNLNDESFETAFTDFELELIKVAKEREEISDITLGSVVDDREIRKLKSKSENRVKFHDDVEIYRLSSESNWSETSTPEKQRSILSQGSKAQESSPGTPKHILRERLSSITEEYNTLREFTTLERQVLSAQQVDFDSPTEKMFMKKQIDDLIERLGKYSTYQTELQEQLTMALSCIKGLSSQTPDIFEIWNPSIFSDERGEVNTFGELKQLQELLVNLKNEQNNKEKVLTPLEKKLTNDYNECLKELDQVRSEKESLFQENTEIKKRLIDESNKLKNTDMLVDTLRTDTDCLMEKLIQKNAELAKLKERIVELERINNEFEKSTTDLLEISTKKENEAEMSLKLINFSNDTSENQDMETSRLKEIIEEKTHEIVKYRQFEEEIKLENERLQQSLDAIFKVEKISQECQTDILEYENQTSMNLNQDKDIEITKLLQIVEEKELTIENYQKLDIQKKQKIEELQQCLDSKVNFEKVSQECQTENINDHGKELQSVLEQNKEISALQKIIEEKSVEILNCKQIQEELNKKIEHLQNANIIGKVEQNSTESQTLNISINKDTNVDLEKDIEISRLKEVIQEKSHEISNLMQSNKEYRIEIEQLQLSLENAVTEKMSTKESQTEDISLTVDLYTDKNNEISGLLELIQLKSSEIERYKQVEEEMKIEIERLQSIENKVLVEKVSVESQTESVVEINNEMNANSEKENQISMLQEIMQEKTIEIEKYKQSEDQMKKEIENLQQCLDNIKNMELISTESQTEDVSSKESDSCNKKVDEISNQLEIIEEKTIEIEKYKKSENEMKTEIERLQQSLDNINVELISKESQTEDKSGNECNSCNEKVNEISNQLEIIKEKVIEIEKYKQTEDEMKKEIENLQQCLSNIKNIELISKESQTHNISSNECDSCNEKVNEISNQLEIIEKKTIEIEKYKQSEDEINKEIEQLKQHLSNINHSDISSVQCQTDSLSENNTNEIHLELQKTEISKLSDIVQEKQLLIEEFEQTVKEMRNEIECLQQRLETITKAEKISEECQTDLISDTKQHNEIRTNVEKDNEILKLLDTIQGKSLEIENYKLLMEEMKNEIEYLQQNLNSEAKLEKISQEIQTENASDNESILNELEMSNQIKSYQKEIEALKKHAENSKEGSAIATIELEDKVTSLNNELSTKIKNIEELNSLNSALKNSVFEKSNELSNLQQAFEIKVQNLEQNINIIVLERNELKEKIDSVYSSNKLNQDFMKEAENLNEIIKKLKNENDTLKKRLQILETESSQIKENSLLSTTPVKPNAAVTAENTFVESPIVKSEENKQSKSVIDMEENKTAPTIHNSFIKPVSELAGTKEFSPVSSKSNALDGQNDNKSFVKPLNKTMETSSIFANMTYFDNMEVSQSFVQDSTALLTGIDETKNSTCTSMHIDNNMTNQTMSEPVAMNSTDNTSVNTTVNTTVLFENNKDLSGSINIQSPISVDGTESGPFTMEQLEKIKISLEKENTRLCYDLQKKIQETEEVQNVIREFKQTLEELQQTICILTNENMDMSKQLTEARESNNQIVNNLQVEIDTLTARLSMITEERVALKSELELVSEHLENVRSVTPVITDDEIKRKVFELQEQIKSLTDENIELSTNLMEKIEELEKVKESKIQLYDHECIYKEKVESLTDKMQCLEKENIELSSDLTEQIEEADKLKETVDVLKQQLEAHVNQKSSECLDNNDLEFFKGENARLTTELIELRAKLTQLSKENANLSANLALDDSDEHNASLNSSRKTSNISSAALETSTSEGSCNEMNSISSMNKKVKDLEDQVEHLTLLNKKLGELKLTNCNQCSHLKELNESRRQLKLEVKLLNQKLVDLQKNFDQKCTDTEILRAKANEDLNASISFMDSTINGSLYDGLNVTVIEEKVQNLRSELEELKENHNKLSNQYKEKCNELEKLQLDNSPLADSTKKGSRRSTPDTPSRKNSARIQALQKHLENLNNDLQEIKKSNANVSGTLSKFMAERNETMKENESLKLLNEELKKEFNVAQGNALQYEEKTKLLEEELSILYKRVEEASVVEKDLQAQKLEIEVQLESLLKEKSEFTNTLQNKEEKFQKDLEDCKIRIRDYEKENKNLKNELEKLEDIIQKMKIKNDNYMEMKLTEEIESAKSRIMKEIRSLTSLSEKEWKELPKKSVTDIFVSFLNAILAKETEIVSRLQEEFEKSKRRLEEEKQQSIDAERRANIWAKTLETDLEKLQGDLTDQEYKNRNLENQVRRLEENLKEAIHENQQLHSNIRNMESDLNILHNELEKKSKTNEDRDSAINAAQEKEKLAKTKEVEWENRLRLEKEDHMRELEELNKQLESYKSINDDLRNTVEGLDLEIEHLKNTFDIKKNDYEVALKKIEELQIEMEIMEKANQELKTEITDKNKNMQEISDLMKIKCDLLTEYKTKVETMKPEFESLQSQLTERKVSIEKLKEDIHNLKLDNQRQADILQDKLSDEQIKSAGLTKQLVEFKNKNTALCTTIEEFKDRCAELERENANLQRKVRNSTSKVKVESELQELQDENRSLKNHLEGSYNRIKELQESKSQVQRELTEVRGKSELFEQELNTTKTALESLREKYNNVNLQKLREKYELVLREKNNIIREVEEKKMLIANKDQKLVEFSIEMDTLKKQKETLDKDIDNIKKENMLVQKQILNLTNESEKLRLECCDLKEKIKIYQSEKGISETSYKALVEEKNNITVELVNCKREIEELQNKNKELDEEMDELITHIHKQENEIAELQDRLIVGSSNESVEKLHRLEEEIEKLKIDLRVTEVNREKLQNEVIRLYSDKESLQKRIEDLNNINGELEAKYSSRNSSKSNSPTTQKGRRRTRRSDLYNQNRNIDLDSDNKEITDTDSPSITPTPPAIKTIDEECRICNELRNRIREMSLDLVSRNNKITVLEMQLQSQNFPYQIKCNELQEKLLEAKTRNSELKLEIQKLQRVLMEDSSRECQVCRHRKRNRRDQSVQVSPQNKISMSGMSSGIVEDHLKLEKLEKEKNIMKDLCRTRAREIKKLELRVRELEGLKIS